MFIWSSVILVIFDDDVPHYDDFFVTFNKNRINEDSNMSNMKIMYKQVRSDWLRRKNVK